MKSLRLANLLAVAVTLTAQTEEGRRVALVIGNNAYTIRPLQNAINDARAVQKSLAGAGFQVDLRENAGRAAMEEAASVFLGNLRQGDTALFYYAGHAVQIEGENVLIPTDFESATNMLQVRLKSFSMSLIFNEFKRSRAKRLVVILDACRNNPVTDAHRLAAGLANPSDPGKETYIAFSTSPGSVAGDNPDGTNSWFTAALADAIVQPNLSLDDSFIRVRDKVQSATGGKQVPWSITNLTSKFYFHPPQGVTESAEAQASLVSKWFDDALRQAQYGNWREAIDLAERVLKQKPGATLEESAQARLPHWRVRHEAETKFEAGDIAGALGRFEEAQRLDPFDMDAALEAANCALLLDDPARATKALAALRQTGTSAQGQRAEAILKEIAGIDAAAAASLKQPPGKPPGVQQVFARHRFGVPDFEAAAAWAAHSPAVDYAAVVKRLPPPPAPPQPPAVPPTKPELVETSATLAQAAEPQSITLNELYADVKAIAGARDLVAEDVTEVTIKSSKPGLGLKLDGKPVARQLPFTAPLAPGEYEIRIMDNGRKVSERRLRVTKGMKELVL